MTATQMAPIGPHGGALPAFIQDPARKRLMSPAEFAGEYGFTVSSLAKARLRGDGPPYLKLRERGAIKYRREDVEAWLAEHLRTSTSYTA
jgi:hypothetical protein